MILSATAGCPHPAAAIKNTGAERGQEPALRKAAEVWWAQGRRRGTDVSPWAGSTERKEDQRALNN